MDDKEHKELISRMVDTLREHSVPYREGSWERFKRMEGNAGKRVAPFWYWSSAAAIILLATGLFLFRNAFDRTEELPNFPSYVSEGQSVPEQGQQHNDNGGNPSAESPGQVQAPLMKGRQAQVVAEHTNKQSGHTLGKISVEREALRMEASSRALSDNLMATKALEQQENKEPGKTGQLGSESAEDIPASDENDKVAKQEDKNDALLRMLSESGADDSKTLQIAEQAVANKHWNFAVLVSPALSNERVNMGGGVSVAYQISKKVSIGSGVSLVDLGFRQNAASSPNNALAGLAAPATPAALSDASPMFSAKSVETNELTSIHTNVLALDIPIDIKYHLNKRFYASAGFSIFAVLNEDRTNNYISRIATNRVATNFADGYVASEPQFQVMNTSEKSNDLPLQGNSYSGFLNFSVGSQMPLSKKVGLAVEPFFKLPVGELSRQSVDFKYGGLRVITSF